DLTAILSQLNAASGPDLELVGDEHRVKSAESLKRKYALANRANPQTVLRFLSSISDVVRFSILTHESGYGSKVNNVLSQLIDMGYSVNDIKNLWRSGNWFQGLNVKVTTPTGEQMEIQFPTKASLQAGSRSHFDYEILRLPELSSGRRVEALAAVLQANSDFGVDTNTPDTSGLPTPPNYSTEQYFRRRIGLRRMYIYQLRQEGLGQTEAGFDIQQAVVDHLTAAGFPAPVAGQMAAAIEAADRAESVDRAVQQARASAGQPAGPDATNDRDPARSESGLHVIPTNFAVAAVLAAFEQAATSPEATADWDGNRRISLTDGDRHFTVNLHDVDRAGDGRGVFEVSVGGPNADIDVSLSLHASIDSRAIQEAIQLSIDHDPVGDSDLGPRHTGGKGDSDSTPLETGGKGSVDPAAAARAEAAAAAYEAERDARLEAVKREHEALVRALKATEPEAFGRLGTRVREADSEAARVQADLESIMAQLNDANFSLELAGTDARVKSVDSVARKYAAANAFDPVTTERFLDDLSDLVRFTVVTPDAVYDLAVDSVVSSLLGQGYELDVRIKDGNPRDGVKNYWLQGNRYPGLTVNLKSPGGERIELKFPSQDSHRADVQTHDDYELMRLHTVPVDARVTAFARILQANVDARLDDNITATRADPRPIVILGVERHPIDNGPERWFSKGAGVQVARDYSALAARQGVSTTEMLTAVGISPELASRLSAAIEAARRGDVEDGVRRTDLLPGDEQVAPGPGESVHRGDVRGARPSASTEPSDQELDVRPDVRSSEHDGRSGRSGGEPDQAGESDPSRGDRDPAAERSAERGAVAPDDAGRGRPTDDLSDRPTDDSAGDQGPRHTGGKGISDSTPEDESDSNREGDPSENEEPRHSGGQGVLDRTPIHPGDFDPERHSGRTRPYAATRDEFLRDIAETTTKLLDTLPQSSLEQLWDAAANVRHIADQAWRDFTATAARYNQDHGTRLELAGTDFRVKPTSSLARKYAIANNETPQDAATFARELDDLVRFSVLTQEADYGKTVLGFLAHLAAQGYALNGPDAITNLWNPGNLYHGLTVALVHQASGQLIELQFPTRASYELGKATHPDYQVIRLAVTSVAKRVEAVAHYVQLNAQADIDGRLPDTTGLPAAKSNEPTKFFDANGEMSRYYRSQVKQRGLTVRQHMLNAGFSLEIAEQINEAVKGDSGDGSSKAKRGKRSGNAVRERADVLPRNDSQAVGDVQPVHSAGVDGAHSSGAPSSSNADVDVRSDNGSVRDGGERDAIGGPDQRSESESGRGDRGPVEQRPADRGPVAPDDAGRIGKPDSLTGSEDGPRHTGGKGVSDSSPDRGEADTSARQAAVEAAVSAIVADPNDVADIVASWPLNPNVQRYTPAVIERIKTHLFVTEHRVPVLDGNGQPTGEYALRRLGASPEIVEAWIRLSEGRALKSDIILLEHQGIETAQLEHSGSYEWAHASANNVFAWGSAIAPSTGENIDNWVNRHADPAASPVAQALQAEPADQSSRYGRPADLTDIPAQAHWAATTIAEINANPDDVAAIEAVLAQDPNIDAPFTADEIAQIKKHLFAARLSYHVVDPIGPNSATWHPRFNASPDTVEAWLRLREERPLDTDIELLEDHHNWLTQPRFRPDTTSQPDPGEDGQPRETGGKGVEGSGARDQGSDSRGRRSWTGSARAWLSRARNDTGPGPTVTAADAAYRAARDAELKRVEQQQDALIRQLTMSDPDAVRQLRNAVRNAGGIGRGVKADLDAILSQVGGSTVELTLVGTGYQVQTTAAFLRTYAAATATDPVPVDEFIGQLNDLVRFSVLTPEAGYDASVNAVLSALLDRDYRVDDSNASRGQQDGVGNYWLHGNTSVGLTVNLRTPSDQRVELQFATPESHRVSEDTRPDFQLLRSETAPLHARILALARILQATADANLDSKIRATRESPTGIEILGVERLPSDNGPEHWFGNTAAGQQLARD
ncbi:MAG: hypothetical protein M3400_08635, partial [Actinomycetota bacterium]|nr:hypothetical protein [Actinomycetota bacterium]